MTDLLCLSDRIRVYSAVSPDGGCTITLDREQAEALATLMELGDRVHAAAQAAIRAEQRRVATLAWFDRITLVAACIILSATAMALGKAAFRWVVQ